MSSLIRIGVLEGQEEVHYGLHAHLNDQPGIAVAGTYSGVRSALLAIEQGNVDLLLVDYMLQDNDGQHLIKTLRGRHPELRLLVFLAAPCRATANVALAMGLPGIVCKRESLDVCVPAIRLLVSDQCNLCISMAIMQVIDLSGPLGKTDDAEAALISHPSLSQREREVLRLCISGLTVSRIAEMSERSLKTVSTQKLAAYRKLGLKNDMDLFKRLSRYAK